MNSVKGWVYSLLQYGYEPDAKKPDPIGAYLVPIPASGKNADANGCLLFSAPPSALLAYLNRAPNVT